MVLCRTKRASSCTVQGEATRETIQGDSICVDVHVTDRRMVRQQLLTFRESEVDSQSVWVGWVEVHGDKVTVFLIGVSSEDFGVDFLGTELDGIG